RCHHRQSVVGSACQLERLPTSRRGTSLTPLASFLGFAKPSLLRPSPRTEETTRSSGPMPPSCQPAGPVLPTFSGSFGKGCSHPGVKRRRRDAEEEGSRSGPGSESPNEPTGQTRHLPVPVWPGIILYVAGRPTP